MDVIIFGLCAAAAVILLFFGDYFWKRRLYLIGVLVGVIGVSLATLVLFILTGGPR